MMSSSNNKNNNSDHNSSNSLTNSCLCSRRRLYCYERLNSRLSIVTTLIVMFSRVDNTINIQFI